MTTMGEGTPMSGAWAREWAPPAPKELPALRESLAEHMRNPYAHVALTRVLELGKGTLSPHTGDLGKDAAFLLAEERARLSDAVLYFVTADMTRLARAAAETLPVTTFRPHDVPSASGFCVFAEPIGGYIPDADADPSDVGRWPS